MQYVPEHEVKAPNTRGGQGPFTSMIGYIRRDDSTTLKDSVCLKEENKERFQIIVKPLLPLPCVLSYGGLTYPDSFRRCNNNRHSIFFFHYLGVRRLNWMEQGQSTNQRRDKSARAIIIIIIVVRGYLVSYTVLCVPPENIRNKPYQEYHNNL